MARFDVYPMPRRSRGYLLDVQADLLGRLTTRVVVPLLHEDDAPPTMTTLNPVFDIHGVRHVMQTHSIATIPKKELGEAILSLADHQSTIMNALDFLFSGC